MPALPAFSRGLKLVRIAVYAMLLQLAVTIVMTIKALTADTGDLNSVLDWSQYLLLANALTALAMLVGTVGAIPELARSKMPLRSLATAAIGFAIATAALVWSYRTISAFFDVVRSPRHDLDELMARVEDLKSLGWIAVVKDLAYSIGLIALIGMVERSAAANDQLALRDEAGSMRRALIVMLVADAFRQLTYDKGGAVGIYGLLGALLISGYWIYCHIRLARFLYNAAYFMNEPSDLPVATVIRDDKSAPTAVPAPRPSQPIARPSQPKPAPRPVASAPPPPIVVVDPKPAAPTPMAVSADGSDGDGPKFLR